jgi:hypothetical protein
MREVPATGPNIATAEANGLLQFTSSFQPQFGPGMDSTSIIYEYQEYFGGGRADDA